MSRNPVGNRRLLRAVELGTWLALAALLYLVDLFLPWHQACSAPIGGVGIAPSLICTYGASSWDGAGVLAAVLAGLLLLWEVTRVARADVGLSVAYRSLVSAALSFGVLLFGVIHVLAQLTWLSPGGTSLVYGGAFLWLSLALAVVIGLIGLLHWDVWEMEGPSLPGTGPAPLAGPAPAPQPPVAPPRACSNCGRINAPDASFCAGCGQSLGPMS